ncbi:Integral membrane protein OS=Streptomyces tendae OX=1932 GN=GUR47_25575 PE=4 SV=1 [Streptomyces tendae]
MSLGDDHHSSGDYGGAGQTRLRLPEEEGGPRRGGRSSSRSLVTVVGVVVLLIAAIAFANRGGDDFASAEGGDGDKPKTSSTAPSGTRPVRSGFAHDEQGAQSAAANYAVALVSADILKPARRAEIVQQVFVTDKQAALADKFDKVYSEKFLSTIGLDKNGNATGGNTYVSRTMPIGTKATRYSDTSTTVDVWCTGVFGTAGEKTTTPVSSDWFTMTLQLRWVDSDWKVESFSQKDGPAPVPGDNKASSADEMSKAVQEYGGFTYAR